MMWFLNIGRSQQDFTHTNIFTCQNFLKIWWAISQEVKTIDLIILQLIALWLQMAWSLLMIMVLLLTAMVDLQWKTL